MPQPSANPITFTVGEETRLSGLLQVPPRAVRLLRVRAWCGRRHGAPVHGGGRERTCGAQHRDAALSISLHGEAGQAPRSAQGRTRGGARRRRGGAAAIAEPAAHRGRQVLRRPHDLAGAGCWSRSKALSGLAFLGFPLHPANRPSRERAAASRRRANPDAVLAGHRAMRSQSSASSSRCARPSASLATLKLFADADHSFHVPARTGRKDAEVRGEMLDAMAEWIARVSSPEAAARALDTRPQT